MSGRTITVTRQSDGTFLATLVEGERTTRIAANHAQSMADFLAERLPGVVVQWDVRPA